MGSVLGVLYAQAIMAHTEEQVIQQFNGPPFLYCRYIDDIFVSCDSVATLSEIKERIEQVSGLKLTTEMSEEGNIPSLDVLVQRGEPKFNTLVYRKATNVGVC